MSSTSVSKIMKSEWILELSEEELRKYRLLKNAHLRRCPRPSSLQRTSKYASLLRISGALHPGIFDQPERNDIFNKLNRLDHE